MERDSGRSRDVRDVGGSPRVGRRTRGRKKRNDGTLGSMTKVAELFEDLDIRRGWGIVAQLCSLLPTSAMDARGSSGQPRPERRGRLHRRWPKALESEARVVLSSQRAKSEDQRGRMDSVLVKPWPFLSS